MAFLFKKDKDDEEESPGRAKRLVRATHTGRERAVGLTRLEGGPIALREPVNSRTRLGWHGWTKPLTPVTTRVTSTRTANRRSCQEKLTPQCWEAPEALRRTRTDDPFLTMEVLYQLS